MASYKVNELTGVGDVEQTFRNESNLKKLMNIDLPTTEDQIVLLRRIIHELYAELMLIKKTK